MAKKDIEIDKIYKDIFENKKNIILAFYTSLYGPSFKSIEVLEEARQESGIDHNIININFDLHSDIAKQFEVVTLPTIIIFREGKEIGRFTGSQTKEQYKIIFGTINCL